MVHVLDDGESVCAGDLSESTQLVAETFDDELAGSGSLGLRILHGDPCHGLRVAMQNATDDGTLDIWRAIADWELD